MSSLSGMRPGTGVWRMVLALVRQRRRLWLATFAVALSVGYLAGALTLLNRVSEGLKDLSSAGAEKSDLVIEGEVAYESALEQTRRLIPSSIAQSLIGQPGIAAVAPRVEDVVMLIGPDGNALVTPGLSEQPLGANWPDDPVMSPYRFVGEGRAPKGSDEVVIDHRSARKAELSVGDQVGVVARSGLASLKIVGIVTTERGDLPEGSSLALMSTDRARELFQMDDNDTRVAIRLEKGADADQVTSQIQAWLPSGSIIVDGETGAMHRQESLTRSFTLIRVLIMGFAGLALVVGMVTVANSLTLLYSERRHSFATFRLVGAKRYQIMGAALAEAAMLAGAASVLGAPLGLVLGGLIEVVLGLLGTSVPVAGSLLSIPALMTAVVVGALATVFAAVIPAWKACGVPAIEAVVASESGRELPFQQRLVRAAIIATAVGVVVLGFLSIAGWFAGSMIRISLIVALVVLAISQLPTGLAYAVASGIQVFPERSGALRRIGARDAIRNRTRTAATTGALMLATAVVVGLAVFLSSFASSLDADVSGLTKADLIIDSGTFTVGGLPAGLIEKVADTDGVDSVSGWQVGRVNIGNLPARVTGMDGSSVTDVIDPDWVGTAPEPLSEHGIALSQSMAEQLGVQLGSELPVDFASRATVLMTVEGIYASGEVLLGQAVVNRSLLSQQVPKSTDIFALVTLKDHDGAAREAVTKLGKSFGVKAVLDPRDFVDSRSALLKGFERVIQWMLLFTLLQALIGVVNTLLLSVGERRREFGLLRAAGASRQQVLRLVLVEGGSFAVIGTALGLFVGVLAARIAVASLGRFGITGFTVPIPILIVTALAASLLGIVAAVIPARWAAAVPPLEAVVDSGGESPNGTLLERIQTWITERRIPGVVSPAPAREPGPITTSVPQTATAAPTASTVTATTLARTVSTAPLSSAAGPPVAGSAFGSAPSEAVTPPPFDGGRISPAPETPAPPDEEVATVTEAPAAWLKPRTAAEGSRTTGGHATAGGGSKASTDGPKAATSKQRGARRPADDREHVLFAPGGGTADQVRVNVRPTQVPKVLEEPLARLSPQSVIDAAPLLPTLASTLQPGETIASMVQGWAKGLACVIARTDKRVIVVVNRFPEPLVESLHPTRTGVSLYGPPGVGHVSVAVVDGRRLLEVSGVHDRGQAMALRSDTSPTPRRRRGYF